MWKHNREDPVGSHAAELLLECQALLAGRMADHLGAQGRWAPPWAWVNTLAHATEAELTSLVTDDPRTRAAHGGVTEWRGALVFLAEDVLAHAHASGLPLTQLQRSMLVPLELDLLRHGDGPALTPGQVAAMVLRAVHRHPSRPQS